MTKNQSSADTSLAIATLDAALSGSLGKAASDRAHAWLAGVVGREALAQTGSQTSAYCGTCGSAFISGFYGELQCS